LAWEFRDGDYGGVSQGLRGCDTIEWSEALASPLEMVGKPDKTILTVGKVVDEKTVATDRLYELLKYSFS